MPDQDVAGNDNDALPATAVKKIICSRNGVCLRNVYPPFCPCGNEVKECVS